MREMQVAFESYTHCGKPVSLVSVIGHYHSDKRAYTWQCLSCGAVGYTNIHHHWKYQDLKRFSVTAAGVVAAAAVVAALLELVRAVWP